jgi:hypothetical protein
MKKILFILMAIAMLLLFGCAAEKQVEKPAEPPKYTGFMEWKAGMWTEMISIQSGEKVKQRMEIIENSPTLSQLQIITEKDGIETVSQIWIDLEERVVSKFVTKTDDEVLCLNIDSIPLAYVPADPRAYPPDDPEISYGIYTTPTDKKVVVAKFERTTGDSWVSSEVPFGIVKVEVAHKTAEELYDFGTIGAKSRISDEEIEACTDLTDTVYMIETVEEQEEEPETETIEETEAEVTETDETVTDETEYVYEVAEDDDYESYYEE